jgi:hypothetical protein
MIDGRSDCIDALYILFLKRPQALPNNKIQLTVHNGSSRRSGD